MHTSGSQIQISNLTKTFSKSVINNLSFKCNSSESVVILGESGAGKSVLMRMIGMLLDATSGSIKIDDDEIVGIDAVKRDEVMEKVGFLFQYSGLFDHLSILENVAFREIFVKKMNRDDAFDLAIAKLKQMNIKDHTFNLKPYQISGGMQRRVAMARTLMKMPKLILLDEPTSGLDPLISDVVNDVILEARKETNATMITITHDLNSALKIADKIFVLHNGVFEWHGNAKDIFSSHNVYTKQFVKAANILN